MKIYIKRLCLANGDEYEDVTVNLNKNDLIAALKDGDVIPFEVKGREVLINADFIISIEQEEGRKLSVI